MGASNGCASHDRIRRASSAPSSTARPDPSGSVRRGVSAPHHRRYIPGTMVLETTWHTPTGWLVVEDLLVIRPTDDQPAEDRLPAGPGRPDGGGGAPAEGPLPLRQGRGGGDLRPAVRLRSGHRTMGVRRVTAMQALSVKAPDGDPRLIGGIKPAARDRGRPLLRAHEPVGGRRVLHCPDVERIGTDNDRGQLASDIDSTVAFWRDWLATGTFPDHPWRPLHRAERPDTEGPELRADRSDHGRLDHLSARNARAAPGTGTTATHGSVTPGSCCGRSTGWASIGRPWNTLPSFWIASARVTLDQPFELQIMYGIGGERDLTESTLDHLSGYDGARPVRVGNGAWDQHQNDVWGMLLDGVDQHFKQGAGQIVHPVWEGLAGLVDEALSHSGDADQGIWEIRGEPQHFTASAVLCWVAADRGANLAIRRGDAERAEALAQGCRRT